MFSTWRRCYVHNHMTSPRSRQLLSEWREGDILRSQHRRNRRERRRPPVRKLRSQIEEHSWNCNRDGEFQIRARQYGSENIVQKIHKRISRAQNCPADKTTSIYKVNKDEYERLLTSSITADYKKEETSLSNEINYSGKEILKDHHIIKRMDRTTPKVTVLSL